MIYHTKGSSPMAAEIPTVMSLKKCAQVTGTVWEVSTQDVYGAYFLLFCVLLSRDHFRTLEQPTPSLMPSTKVKGMDILLCFYIFLLGGPARIFHVSLTSDSFPQDLPRGARVSAGYANFSADFAPGVIYPTQLLLESHNNESMISREFFRLCNSIVRKICAATATSLDDWQGICVAHSPFTADSWFELYMKCHQAGSEDNPVCEAILLSDHLLLNATQTATLLVFSSPGDPLSPEGDEWLQKARPALNAALNDTHVAGYFIGTPIDSWDSINLISFYFPIIIGISLAVVRSLVYCISLFA